MRYALFSVLFVVSPIVMATPLALTVTREAEFDGCHFKLSDPYSGNLGLTTDGALPLAYYSLPPTPDVRHTVEVSIRFRCKTLLGMEAFAIMGFAHEDGEWQLIPDESDPDNISNLKIYRLHGPGVEGVASTYDQTAGEPNERTQGLGFCLTDQKQILCGISEVVGYVAYPKESNLPQVLKLLESIEFLEPTPSAVP